MNRSLPPRSLSAALALRRYFYSGWAFLIPYLVAYLLYYVLKWPVNPVVAGGAVKGISGGGSVVSGQWSAVPPLLHVFWALHAVNAVLAGIALVAWWRNASRGDFSAAIMRNSAGQQSVRYGRGSVAPIGARTATANLSAKALAAAEASDDSCASLRPSLLVLLWSRLRRGRPSVARSPSVGSTRTDTPAAHEEIAPTAPLPQLPPVRSSQEEAKTTESDGSGTATIAGPSCLLSPVSCLLRAALRAVAPWLLLALLFYIPGVYLEFPADPWEHYRRINEWSWLHTVGEHTIWSKSSYFLDYSLLGRIAPPTRQLFWLNFYYTGCCLLLCWQYYRLARAVGLGERASMLFVILQSVLFGNNIFGFYRYYGLASTIFGQLGAVALIRIAIEFANQKFQARKNATAKGVEFSQEGAPTAPLAQLPPVRSSQEGAEEAEGLDLRSAQIQACPDSSASVLPASVSSVARSASVEPSRTDAPAAHEEIACKQAPTTPLSSLPSVESSQESAEIAEKNGATVCKQVPTTPLSPFPPAKQNAGNLNGMATRSTASLRLLSLMWQLFRKIAGPSCLLSPVSWLLRAALCAACLLALIAFNHPQGLGIAALGLAVVGIWRLIEWRRSMVWWLATTALALSVAAVLWWPRHPALDAAYRPGGWLTAWYGFNVFSFRTDAGDRTRQIIGFFGLINLVAACVLLRRNHVIGWLTITPLFALCLPFVAIPFAGVLAKHAIGWGQIIAFQRMLFAIPAGLAIVCLGAEIANRKCQVPGAKCQESRAGISQEGAEEAEGLDLRNAQVQTCPDSSASVLPASVPSVARSASVGSLRMDTPTAHEEIAPTAPLAQLPPVRPSQEIAKEAEDLDLRNAQNQACPDSSASVLPASVSSVARSAFRLPLSAFPLCLLSLAALLVVPANRPFYNRFWNALMIPPADLAMRHVVADFEELPFIEFRGVSRLLTNPGLGFVLQAAGAKNVFYLDSKTIISSVLTPPSGRADLLLHFITVEPIDRFTGLLLIPPVAFLQTPNSHAAYLSGHWLSQEVALHHVGGPEAEVIARKAGGQLLAGNDTTFYLFVFGDMAAGSRKEDTRPAGAPKGGD